jgi:hypothetical protein
MELTASAELCRDISGRKDKICHMPDDEEYSEPVMCSKCNFVFSTEREYLQNYSENAQDGRKWLTASTNILLAGKEHIYIYTLSLFYFFYLR